MARNGLALRQAQCNSLYISSPNQFISHAPDIDDLHVGISLEVLAKLGNEYIKTTGIEKAIIAPDTFQDSFSRYHILAVLAEDAEYFTFTGGELPGSYSLLNDILGGIKSNITNSVILVVFA